MNASIALTKMVGDPELTPGGAQHAWPLTLQAVGTDIPSEIFVYQIDPAGDRFSCVATVSQLEELPKFTGQSMTSETGIPFYRTAQMTVVCRNPDEVERVWGIAQQHVQFLVDNWNATFALVGVEQVTIASSPEVVS